MSELCIDEEPLPSFGELDKITDYFHSTCQHLAERCGESFDSTSSGLWRGIDLPALDAAAVPTFFADDEELYKGPFGKFCKKAVRSGKYRRFGGDDEPMHIRLKLVPTQDDFASITLLLQQEYIGYDVFIRDGVVCRKQSGQKIEYLEGEKGFEILEDIRYVANRIITHAYEMEQQSRTLESCDSPAQSVKSKELETRPRRSFGRRALRLFRT